MNWCFYCDFIVLQLSRILQLCPNAEVLDLSQTKISDLGLHKYVTICYPGK